MRPLQGAHFSFSHERAILGAEYQKWTPRMTPKRKVAYLLATYVQ